MRSYRNRSPLNWAQVRGVFNVSEYNTIMSDNNQGRERAKVAMGVDQGPRISAVAAHDETLIVTESIFSIQSRGWVPTIPTRSGNTGQKTLSSIGV
jgi:hypothetical protein